MVGRLLADSSPKTEYWSHSLNFISGPAAFNLMRISTKTSKNNQAPVCFWLNGCGFESSCSHRHLNIFFHKKNTKMFQCKNKNWRIFKETFFPRHIFILTYQMLKKRTIFCKKLLFSFIFFIFFYTTKNVRINI